MNDEHTDVLIINKTCETQMSDDEQAGIDPERKSSEQQKKERDARALRRSQGIPASSPVKLTDSEKILITRDIEGIIINCARRGLKKDSIKSYHINKYRKENNVPRNFFFPSVRFDELYKAFYKGDDDEGDDDEGDDDKGDDDKGDDDDGGRNLLEVSALSIIRSREIEVLEAEMTALAIKEEEWQQSKEEEWKQSMETSMRTIREKLVMEDILIYEGDLQTRGKQEESLPRKIRENLEEMNPTYDDDFFHRLVCYLYTEDIRTMEENFYNNLRFNCFPLFQAISLLQATVRRNRASFNPRLMRLRLARMRDKADASDDEEEDNH